MGFFAPPELIKTEVFAEVPKALQKTSMPAERIAAGKSVVAAGSFLEGPTFDREGYLWCVDIPYGRIFRVSPKGEFELVLEYDGEPNGLVIHKDGRIFVADHKYGVMLLESGKTGKTGTAKLTPHVTRYHQQGFKGVNDLTYALNGDLYFTDQGQSDLADPTGCVYRHTAAGLTQRIASNVASPNGLVLDGAGKTLYVAVTRANAVWRMPFAPDGTVVRMGLQIQLSGGRGPDGMAIDENDGLAVAHPDMGAVWIFNHRGEPAYRVQSCKSDVLTNLCYGGADRKTMFITDAGSGCILSARVPVAGRVLYSHV
jgi:gluconolactonase